jgi:xyloglucan-specific endo-beta-1,4-glucanase
MKVTQAVVPFVLASLVAGSPTPTLDKRATTICGQWDTVETGTYTVYQDLWGEAAATSGSQCTTVDSDSSGTLVWSTAWTWEGGSSSVKSYANAVVSTTSQQISAISSIPTTWKWRSVPAPSPTKPSSHNSSSYTGTSIVADIFTSATSGGANAYEIMIWLAAIGGAGPISSTGSAIATTTINGVTFKLYSGPNGSTTVCKYYVIPVLDLQI